jgi:hypothetical protein
VEFCSGLNTKGRPRVFFLFCFCCCSLMRIGCVLDDEMVEWISKHPSLCEAILNSREFAPCLASALEIALQLPTSG